MRNSSGAFAFPSPVFGLERSEGFPQQGPLEFLDLRILDRTFPQLVQQAERGDGLELRRRKIGNLLGRDRHRRRFQRKGTDRVVRRVVAARLIDRQDLEHAEAVPMTPIHHLPHAFGIAYSQIVPGPNRKHRAKDPRQFLIR